MIKASILSTSWWSMQYWINWFEKADGNFRLLLTVVFFLLVIIFCLIVGVLIFLILRNREQQSRRQMKQVLHELLVPLMLSSEEGQNAELQKLEQDLQQKLKSSALFRRVALKELINLRMNLTGDAAEKIQLWYEEWNLVALSIRRAYSKKWHKRARGIRELGIMKHRPLTAHIYRNTNHPHPLVRTEAQLSMLRLLGMEGLRFLQVIREPLSEWQMVEMLYLLEKEQIVETERMAVWLKASNPTVVLFTLRLIRIHMLHQFLPSLKQLEVYPDESVQKMARQIQQEWGLDLH